MMHEVELPTPEKKFLLITIPIRPRPTDFPPIGSLSILSYLRKKGFRDLHFYNIDGNRPAYDDVLAHIIAEKPDILGVSAVVSTSYSYVKKLTLDIKRVLPNTLIVLGGGMASSAKLLLKRTGVDICVTGEGEITLSKLLEMAKTTTNHEDFAKIPGLALFVNGSFISTGYEQAVPKEEIYDIDWNDLEKSSNINNFIYPLFDDSGDVRVAHFRDDPRTYEPKRRKKKMSPLPAAKGCVARCTFCHRWEKGIRYIPVDIVMERIKFLIDRYDVGFLYVVDENFGTSKKWRQEFCEKIGKLDVLWHVGGMRVNTAEPEDLELMKKNGCVSALFGMETGSSKMLQIMEKMVKIEDNYNAMKWTTDLGIKTGIQLVLGMPGESPETIKETIEFCKFGTTINKDQNPNRLSINYAQALPGTPLYEIARHRGIIGRTDDAEEKYLEHISDKNASDEFNTINHTDYPKLLCMTWRPRMIAEVNYHHVKKFGLDNYYRVVYRDTHFFQTRKDHSGYFNQPMRMLDTAQLGSGNQSTIPALPSIWSLIKQRNFERIPVLYPVTFYHLRHFIVFFVLLRAIMSKLPANELKQLVLEYVVYQFKNLFKGGPKWALGYQSLRTIVKKQLSPIETDDPNMAPLRSGR